MYKKYRYLNTDVHVYKQTKGQERLQLLQHDYGLHPLSWLRYECNKPIVAINCSYFTKQYVLGRNQGDVRNDTHDQNGFYDLVFTKDGKYHMGKFKSWDFRDNVIAGFSVATVLIKDSKECGDVSVAIASGSKLVDKNPQTALGVLKDGSVILVVSDGRTTVNKGLNGYELRTFLKQHYDLELLCQLDGGGSSEMIVASAIMNEPSDGKERLMFNGLALVDDFSGAEEITPNDNTIEDKLNIVSKHIQEQKDILDKSANLLNEIKELL